jgi:hypothetical protein
MTKSQDAMRRLFRFHAGRQGPLPAILPDGMALVVRNQRGASDGSTVGSDCRSIARRF